MGDRAVSIIDPISGDDATRRGLDGILESSVREGIGDELFLRIVGHVPGYAEALHDAMHVSHVEGNVDHKLKEIIRIQLAKTADDRYFAGLRSAKAVREGLTEERIEAGCDDFDNDPRFTAAEKWALRYAYLMYRAPEQVDKAFYDEGKHHYSEAQIMELGGMIALHYGMQLFMRTLATTAPREVEEHRIGPGSNE